MKKIVLGGSIRIKIMIITDLIQFYYKINIIITDIYNLNHI